MHRFSRPALRRLAALSLLAGISFSAQAHRTFLVPSSTVLSGNAPWVTLDAAAASNVFEFDHMPLKLDNLQVTAPDGSRVAPENAGTGRFRSVFDLPLKQAGSYKIEILNEGLSASYKDNGTLKRWRGNAASLSKEIPAHATELQVAERSSRIETFVTNGKPGGQALKISGKGLELSPVTHPNDLVAGEPASFHLLIDGRPAANVTVHIIQGGIRYRQTLNEQTVVSNAEGLFSVTWAQPGLYWLEAEVKTEQGVTPPASSRIASLALTLEVLPQ